jgi:exodeoxyribonuclease VII small subunit
MPKSKSPKPEEKGFEEQLARLGEITAALEKGELSLEESLSLYKEGVTIAAACRKTLDQAKHTVKIYSEEGLKDFIVENNEAK